MDDEMIAMEAELMALFEPEDTSPSSERPLKSAPAKKASKKKKKTPPATARKRKATPPADTAEHRADLMATQLEWAQRGKRVKCDCYTQRATKRAHTHLMGLERVMKRAMHLLPKMAEAKTATVQERIKEVRRALKATEKALLETHKYIAGVQHIADTAHQRGDTLAMRIACVTAKRTDMQVVTKNGERMRVSDHDDFNVLSRLPAYNKAGPTKRRRRRKKK